MSKPKSEVDELTVCRNTWKSLSKLTPEIRTFVLDYVVKKHAAAEKDRFEQGTLFPLRQGQDLPAEKQAELKSLEQNLQSATQPPSNPLTERLNQPSQPSLLVGPSGQN